MEQFFQKSVLVITQDSRISCGIRANSIRTPMLSVAELNIGANRSEYLCVIGSSNSQFEIRNSQF